VGRSYNKEQKKLESEKLLLFKCIFPLIQGDFYIKKSEAEKRRGKRVKYDCHNNYRQRESRSV
jgi:hypothetical protein